MSNSNLLALAQFLVLTQIKWKCKNNEVTRTIEENHFVIRVQRKDDPEKNFTIMLPLENPQELKLYTRGAMGEIFTDSEEATAIKQLVMAVPVSPSVQAKYLESLYILGEVFTIHPSGKLLESFGKVTETEQAYMGFVKMSESDPDVTLTEFAYVSGQAGGDHIVRIVARIADNNDNELSGRYCVLTLAEQGDSLVDIMFEPESLEAVPTPLDIKHYAMIHGNFSKAGSSPEKPDFKDVIGNEKTSNPDNTPPNVPEDKSKYLFPHSDALSAGDIASLIVHECNTVLGLHTVSTQLDFDEGAFRIAITSPHRTWLNMIVAVKDGIAYLNYVVTTATPNYQHAIKIDESKTMATVGATVSNTQLIRALVGNFVASAPVTMPLPQSNIGAMAGAMSNPQNAYRGDQGVQSPWAFTQSVARRRGDENNTTSSPIHSSLFTSWALAAFPQTTFLTHGEEQDRMVALDQFLRTLGLAPLHRGDLEIIGQITSTLQKGKVSIHELYQIVKALRPTFECTGSLPNDLLV